MARRALVAWAISVAMIGCGGEEPAPVTPKPPPPPVASATETAAPPPSASVAPEPPKPKLSMVEMQKKTIGEALAAWNAHDAKKLSALYTADAINAGPDDEGWEEEKGRESLEKEAGAMFASFPDLKMATVRVILKGDQAVWEWVATGTNTGEFEGEKATGKPMGIYAASVLTFDENGLIKRDNDYDDELAMQVQLGRGPKGVKARPVATLPTGDGEWLIAKDGEDTAKNVEALNAVYTALAKKDEKGFLAVLDADVVHADYTQPEDVKGTANAKKEFGMFSKAFTDLKMECAKPIAVGDFVACEVVMSGTMSGPLGPIKATKKKGTTHGLDVGLIKGGKIVRVTSYGDSDEFAAQFGIKQMVKSKVPVIPATAGGDKAKPPATTPAPAPKAPTTPAPAPKAPTTPAPKK